jgi:hypothetical protein
MAVLNDWSITAANNNSTPPDGAPEGMAYAAVNDVIREIMAVLRRWYADNNGSLTAGGTANAITLTANEAHTALYDAFTIRFRAASANTGAVTLNINSIGAANLVNRDGSSLAADAWQTGDIIEVHYVNADSEFRLVSVSSGLDVANLIIANTADPDLTDTDVGLLIGLLSGQHLEFGDAGIQSKVGAITNSGLAVNPLGGGVTIGEAAANGDTITLQDQSTLVSANQTRALNIQNEQDGTPGAGGNHAVELALQESDGTDRAVLGWVLDDLRLDAFNEGGGIFLGAENAAGTLRNGFSFDPDGEGRLYQNNGLTALRTQLRSTAGNINAASVSDKNGTLRDVGYAVQPYIETSGTLTLDEQHVDGHICGNGSLTITFPDSSDIPTGSQGKIRSRSGSTTLSAAGSVNLIRFNGSSVSSGPSTTVGAGDYVTWQKTGALEYHIFGQGIT